jgi:predicted CXXCH cytochrome family protein
MDLSSCIRCVVCHTNHAVLPPSDEMLGVGKSSTCTGCHSAGDAGYAAAVKMADSAGHLQNGITEAADLLTRAERKGMEVSEDRFALQKAQDDLVESRVLAHAFDLERFLTAANAGIAVADVGIAAAHKHFAELRFRRLGLALSLLVIGAVIVGLALMVRQMERRSSS